MTVWSFNERTAPSSPFPTMIPESSVLASKIARMRRRTSASRNALSNLLLQIPTSKLLSEASLDALGSALLTESEMEKTMSIQAYILIQTEVGKSGSVTKAVTAIAGVTIAEGVTGPYDVIMRAEAANMEELGRSVLAKVQAVPGITRTLTCPVTSL